MRLLCSYWKQCLQRSLTLHEKLFQMLTQDEIHRLQTSIQYDPHCIKICILKKTKEIHQNVNSNYHLLMVIHVIWLFSFYSILCFLKILYKAHTSKKKKPFKTSGQRVPSFPSRDWGMWLAFVSRFHVWAVAHTWHKAWGWLLLAFPIMPLPPSPTSALTFSLCCL